jgi:hypothetical protein
MYVVAFLYTFCSAVTDVYYYCLCQFLPCWKGCGDPKLGWVIVCLSAGWVLVGAGWDGAFMASEVLVRHRRFCWGLC